MELGQSRTFGDRVFFVSFFAAFHRDEGVGDRSDGRSRFGLRVDYNNKEEKRDNKRER